MFCRNIRSRRSLRNNLRNTANNTELVRGNTYITSNVTSAPVKVQRALHVSIDPDERPLKVWPEEAVDEGVGGGRHELHRAGQQVQPSGHQVLLQEDDLDQLGDTEGRHAHEEDGHYDANRADDAAVRTNQMALLLGGQRPQLTRIQGRFQGL